MKAASIKPVRCAIYTRVSTEHRARSGVQLAGRPIRCRLRLYQEPGPCRLDLDPVPL